MSVVSSNVGGLSEVNKEGVTGFLSEVGNVDEMASNALKILEGDLKISKRTREFMRNLRITEHMPQYERLYESMI